MYSTLFSTSGNDGPDIRNVMDTHVALSVNGSNATCRLSLFPAPTPDPNKFKPKNHTQKKRTNMKQIQQTYGYT